VRSVPHEEIVDPRDKDRFVHIVTDEADSALGRVLLEFPTRLATLSLEVSTGRVVDFRAKEHLRFEPDPSAVPLLYPGHLRGGGIIWPGDTRRKPSWIVNCQATAPLLLPSDTYVLVKRFTAKEERRRVVASVFEASDIPDSVVGFENHLNVFHVAGRGLSSDLARGLAAWLNSTVIDRYVRCFNGHTQINATDLRRLPYPTETELRSLGEAMGEAKTVDQEKIDSLVSAHVRELRELVA
jgi:adenine-specific DNA-methyltransferase